MKESEMPKTKKYKSDKSPSPAIQRAVKLAEEMNVVFTKRLRYQTIAHVTLTLEGKPACGVPTHQMAGIHAQTRVNAERVCGRCLFLATPETSEFAGMTSDHAAEQINRKLAELK
jgi:hypothetical protein